MTIERLYEDNGISSSAIFSDCDLYRYTLTRSWGPGRRLLFVMLNPSTADERRNDPTIERCQNRARTLGYDSFRVVNIFAFRATDPQVLREAPAPVGAENDRFLRNSADWADQIVCAWGNHGIYLGRGRGVEGLLRRAERPLLHLGLTMTGAPRHPLYVANALQPETWV